MTRRIRQISYYCDECDRKIRETEFFGGNYECLDCGEPIPFKRLRLGGKRLKFKTSSLGEIVIPRVKDLGKGKSRIYGAWMAQIEGKKLSVYYSCALCGTINDLSDLAISTRGIGECFYCGGCGCDSVIQFKDWPRYQYAERKPLYGKGLFSRGRIKS